MTATSLVPGAFGSRTRGWDASLAAQAVVQAQDASRLRWAVVAALLAHAVLLVVRLPELYASPPQAPESSRRVYVLEERRFKPPARRPEQRIPQRIAVRVPMPDPTPDDPEPLVRERQLQFETSVDDLGPLPEVAPPPPRPSVPIRVSGEVKPPQRVFSPPPVYTELARHAHLQGTVVLDAVIDTEGRVTELQVLRPLGLGLSEAAVDAVSKWRFRPATLNGRPVAVIYTLTVRFELR